MHQLLFAADQYYAEFQRWRIFKDGRDEDTWRPDPGNSALGIYRVKINKIIDGLTSVGRKDSGAHRGRELTGKPTDAPRMLKRISFNYFLLSPKIVKKLSWSRFVNASPILLSIICLLIINFKGNSPKRLQYLSWSFSAPDILVKSIQAKNQVEMSCIRHLGNICRIVDFEAWIWDKIKVTRAHAKLTEGVFQAKCPDGWKSLMMYLMDLFIHKLLKSQICNIHIKYILKNRGSKGRAHKQQE